MPYVVQKHLLVSNNQQVGYHPTRKISGPLIPRFLVIHYTAGASFGSDLFSLSEDPALQASVHILIGRNGEVAQIAPFNRVAWHAGQSQWGNISSLNNHSIGIELSNGGLLKKRADGKYYTWFDKEIPRAEVFEGQHKKGGPISAWHTYTQRQLEVLLEVSLALERAYRFLEILGHDDISWPRKTDPGPAFPMESFASRVLGRKQG